ncbi:hypothetical protein GOBAR_AA39181 [Gossypium barbadense]|uniref:Profilin n=4 Tax=Gossypium TaxID=3633 RepID=A0A2P5VRR0_GOSBA|nr:hypothetical protein GOBAR_AA39181 [Gossypium barbadense]
MSWQAYVDDHLMCDIEGNHLSAAAIIGQDGSVWAQSSNFPQFKPEEITGIMNDFAEPGSLAPTGLYLGGTKYMVIQGEPGAVIRGKKLLVLKSWGAFSRNNRLGVCNGDNACDPLALFLCLFDGWYCQHCGVRHATNGTLVHASRVLQGAKKLSAMTWLLILYAWPANCKGPGGVTVKKTNLALIIGIYDEPMTPGQCNMIVERLGDYLIDQGL